MPPWLRRRLVILGLLCLSLAGCHGKNIEATNCAKGHLELAVGDRRVALGQNTCAGAYGGTDTPVVQLRTGDRVSVIKHGEMAGSLGSTDPLVVRAEGQVWVAGSPGRADITLKGVNCLSNDSTLKGANSIPSPASCPIARVVVS